MGCKLQSMHRCMVACVWGLGGTCKIHLQSIIWCLTQGRFLMEQWSLVLWGFGTAFLLYTTAVVAVVLLLIFHYVPQCGHTHVLVYIAICSLMGSLSVPILFVPMITPFRLHTVIFFHGGNSHYFVCHCFLLPSHPWDLPPCFLQPFHPCSSTVTGQLIVVWCDMPRWWALKHWGLHWSSLSRGRINWFTHRHLCLLWLSSPVF